MDLIIVFASCRCGNQDPGRYRRVVWGGFPMPWVWCGKCASLVACREEEATEADE